MTPRTRRLLFLSVLVLALALPAETVMLRAIQTPSQDVAIQDWAAALDAASLQTMGDQIQLYPFAYRKAVLKASSPARRAEIWRRHIGAYLKVHPELDAATVDTINGVGALASADYFDEPMQAQRNQIRDLAEQVSSRLGRDQAEYLFFYLGPKDGTFASFEPLAMKIENTVRNLFTLSAFSGTCDCAQSWGCTYNNYSCVNWTSCSTNSDWPACGWFWMEPCDGACVW